ncbi:MAG: alginate lyase family protein [Alphaproteobacteria bacterium]
MTGRGHVQASVGTESGRTVTGQSARARAAWLVGRLKNMSPAEVAHRVHEQVKRKTSRRRIPTFSGLVVDDDRLPNMPGLADEVIMLATRQPTIQQDWADDAVRVERNAFRFLGRDWPAQPGLPNWHQDPVTSSYWPRDTYCFDIPYRHAAEIGDVKYVWELGRLRYLQTVAAHARVAKDDAAAALCVKHIMSWLDANPPFQGVAWATGIETALRAISLIVVTTLLPDDAFTKTQRERVLTGLAAHGYWLARFPSRFSSANNHLIAEVCGLHLLGALVPNLAPAKRWERMGREVLEEEVSRQFLPDGVGAEQSPTYAAFSAEFFLLSGTVAHLVGRPFAQSYWESLARHAVAIKAQMDERGHVPAIGDDDEGRVISTGLREEDYVASILGCLAQAVSRPDLAPTVVQPSLRNAFFGLPEAGGAGPTGLSSFVDGGYSVARDRDGGREVMWVMDHGPLGYLSIAAHGHADALAVWLHVDGEPLIVDAGTFQYHADGGWRAHFRSTPAHNTLSVEGADSSVISGTFNWSTKATAALLDLNRDAAWSIEAEHDGYADRFGVVHRRKLERVGAGHYRITDRLTGSTGSKHVEAGFLFAPDVELQRDGASWVAFRGGKTVLRIDHDGPLTGQILRGQEAPKRGWYSPNFGARVPTCLLSFSGDLTPGSGVHFNFYVLSGS